MVARKRVVARAASLFNCLVVEVEAAEKMVDAIICIIS